MENSLSIDAKKTRRALDVATELHLFAKQKASFDPWIEDLIHKTAGKIQTKASTSAMWKKAKIVGFIKSVEVGYVSRQDIVERFGWRRRMIDALVAEMLRESPPRIEEFRLSGASVRGRRKMRIRLVS